MNRLDVVISEFDHFSAQPEDANLYDWFNRDYSEFIEEIRRVQDAEVYKAKKKNLPGITPSGRFRERKESALIQHSGLLQFDIDEKDNLGWDMLHLKGLITQLPYVAYCGYSTSGRGLWGLIPIKYPEKHNRHFEALKNAFASAGVKIDTAPQNVASFRFASYDPEPYINPDAVVFAYLSAFKHIKTKSSGDIRDKVERCIRQIEARQLDITSDYPVWFNLGSALLSEFGEQGRELFHRISRFSPKYDFDDLESHWKLWTRAGAGADIGVFFNLCKQHFISFKNRYDEQFNLWINESGYPADWDAVLPPMPRCLEHLEYQEMLQAEKQDSSPETGKK